MTHSHIRFPFAERRIRRPLSVLLALIAVIIAFPVLSVRAGAAYSDIVGGLTYSAPTGNLSVSSFPSAVSNPKVGQTYYFSLSSTSDWYLKTYELSVGAPGQDYTRIENYTANGYYRYYYVPYTFRSAGTYRFKVTVSTTDGRRFGGEFSYNVMNDGSPQTSSGWQMPVRSAYHTWGSGNSWGANCGSYGRCNSSGRNYHVGIDLKSNTDSGVYAAAAGTVKKTGCNSANGYYAIIQHTLSGKTVYSFYAHLNGSPCVWEGKAVSAGEQIGTIGKSGSSSGDFEHLHFAVVDTLWSGGGYYGYATWFSGNTVTYGGVTYYNPTYIIDNQMLP